MVEMMDVFEQLRMTTETKLCKRLGVVALETYYARTGIEATIEALREMMVGEPKLARMTYNMNPDGEEWTSVWCFDGEQISLDGRQGTDGEQVYVIVLRSGGRLLAPEEPPLDEEK